MCLLRKYCFGDGAVTFDVLNAEVEPSVANSCRQESPAKGSVHGRDATESVAEGAAPDDKSALPCRGTKGVFRFGLNYLDSNVNICMPIFAMHGNHGKKYSAL